MLEELKPSAFELVRRIYNHTFDLAYETDLGRNPLNTSVELATLRALLSELSTILLDNTFDDSDLSGMLDALHNHVETVGRQVGHVWGNESSTGTWGVRLLQVFELYAMHKFKLPITRPEYQKPGYTFLIPDNPVKRDYTICDVTSVRYDYCQVIYKIRPRISTVNGVMSVCHSWEETTMFQTLYFHPESTPTFLDKSIYPKYNA